MRKRNTLKSIKNLKFYWNWWFAIHVLLLVLFAVPSEQTKMSRFCGLFCVVSFVDSSLCKQIKSQTSHKSIRNDKSMWKKGQHRRSFKLAVICSSVQLYAFSFQIYYQTCHRQYYLWCNWLEEIVEHSTRKWNSNQITFELFGIQT